MDKKIMAILVVAVVAVAGVATAFVLMNNNNNDDATFNEGSYEFLARVNEEGSGIYIKHTVVDSYNTGIPVRNGAQFYNVVDGKYVVDISNKAAWAGLTLGTPGATSIQHIQIITLASQMGLNMVSAASTEHTDPSETIYYNEKITNYQSAVEIKNQIDGGILWEPQYSKIIAPGNTKGFEELALTNDLFPDHTCCTIIGSHAYLGGHSDETVRFLAAYNKAVVYIQDALANVGGEKYNKLVDICVQKTSGLTESEIKAALANITYLSADDAQGDLNVSFTNDIKELAQSLIDLGAATKDTNPEKLANAMVNDSYLKQAVNYTYSGSKTATVRVAVIDGDIHQIAIRVAGELGYFAEYGIVTSISTGLDNGGKVADAVIGNQADLGFIGAPPATLKTINAGLIQV